MIQVPHIKRSEVRKSVSMQQGGKTHAEIAKELGCGTTRVGRMIRLHQQYGIEVFARE